MVASLTNDVIWDWHFVSNNVWWSDGYYDIFGFAASDPLAQKHSSRIKHIHPDDRHRVQEAFNSVLQGAIREFNVSYRYQKSNGEYAYVLDRGTVLTEEHGIPYRMIGAMVDVTRLEQVTQQVQKKNAELQSAIQQFRFVTDFMPQMVWSAQPNGYHDFYNQQWYDYTGLGQDKTNSNSWPAILHPDDYEKAWKVWQHSLETGDPFETEYRLRRRDNVYRWFLARAYPMHDEQGSIIKWFGTCTDIDDQKRAEQLLEEKIQSRTRELKLLNKRLEASNSDLLQFASVASHDLKEPLRKIHFFSGLIREQLPGDINGSIATYIDRIIKASSRATNLINDVLSYSRLSGDNLFAKVDLNKVVQEILQDFELVIQEKDAKIRVDTLPVITAVPGQMRQLFQNIINNALKFHKPDQPPLIQIECSVTEKNGYADLKETKGALYEITIKDDGIGFDNQYAQKIFSLFQRLNNKEKYEGTGIGLAIANKIVERHHGIIIAKGEPNKGAEFNIILPEEQAEHRQAREELAKVTS
jgi:two-component system CheB/CheR fusion protein